MQQILPSPCQQGGGGMQPQPTAERMHPYVWPGAPQGHNCKLKKLIPSFHTLQCQFLELFSQSFKHNSDFRKASLKINYNLCRILLGDRRVDQDGDE